MQLADLNGSYDCIITSAKDKSTYTVEFDDGDVRTLARGSLCLQGEVLQITEKQIHLWTLERI